MPARRLSLLAVLTVGAYLRLWHLGSQIPFDDEWHAITFVLDHDFWFLLTHYTRLGANSVPHNLYLWLARQTVGLSEWSIALPSLVAGILLLLYYPRWVWARRQFERPFRVAASHLRLSDDGSYVNYIPSSQRGFRSSRVVLLYTV